MWLFSAGRIMIALGSVLCFELVQILYYSGLWYNCMPYVFLGLYGKPLENAASKAAKNDN